ncbi:MAG: prephenate dehydratase [bacterium]
MDEITPKHSLESLDRQLIELLDRRRCVINDLAQSSQEPETSVDIAWTRIRQLIDESPDTVPNVLLRAVFREILSDQRALLRPVQVAFFGSPATFTHQAALQQFGHSAKYIPRRTIGDVFDAVTRGKATHGVVPVENSTEGAVTHTLDMFVDANARISAEINMRIHHNLLAQCETEQIQRIYSHPQVFGQCRRWLRDNLPGVPLVEVSSTTEAVVRSREEPNAAALASELAAEEYDVPLRARQIEDFQDNTTRFLVLGAEESKGSAEDDKISLMFVVRDRPGALYDCLQPLHQHNVNMTMIESRPSKRRSWEYYFFVDLIGNVNDPTVRQALDELGAHCEFVKVLGNYPRATN